MDSLSKPTDFWFSVQEVHREWNRRYRRDELDKRFDEVHAAILFGLILQQRDKTEYLIGLRTSGVNATNVAIEDLFKIRPEWDRDVDILLKRVKSEVAGTDSQLRLQITRFYRQTLSDDHTSDISRFIIEKKFQVPSDDDLSLLVHIQEGVKFHYPTLSGHLVEAGCPYGRVYLLGKSTPEKTHRWLCIQVFPGVEKFEDLDYSFLDDSAGVEDAKVD